MANNCFSVFCLILAILRIEYYGGTVKYYTEYNTYLRNNLFFHC